ncbi:ParA family protein [Pantoea sp. At-9b]|uniref:ParA family protein n=1 Tax=Pantoea sp. (strain At-9b) TaxID=592316 RepID=UPI0003060E9C|nr:ParA family protein [Pantoea sp. At-9b]
MIMTIVNIKGGVGKSTLAVNIAIARAHPDNKVWLVDGDCLLQKRLAPYVRTGTEFCTCSCDNK